MATKNKKTFYTQPTANGNFVAKCNEDATLQYIAKTRSGALSGVKRLAKRNAKQELDAQKSDANTAQKKKTRVAIVIDKSGSMVGLTHLSAELINKNVAEFLAQEKKTGVETDISVISFDTRTYVVRPMTKSSLIQNVSSSELAPGGATAIYDAVGAAIGEISTPPAKDEDVAYLLMVITDGEENSSKMYNRSTFNTLISSMQATGRWTFTFMVPLGGKQRFCDLTNVPAGNVAEWEASDSGMRAATQTMQNSVQTYSSSRSMGLISSNSFYTNLSNLKPSTLKKNLLDLSWNVKTFEVKKEEEIKKFVERETGSPYVPGSAYYQLTKGEKKVQDYKQLLVKEKTKPQIYGGPDARDVLGIPAGTLSIKPGNHGNFDIFIQSTSNNRKLVRGTKLLLMR